MFEQLNASIDRCGRHVHVTREHMLKLFPHRNYDHGLAIQGQYIIKEKVDVIGKDGRLIKDVTVILPDRDTSYVEVSRSDAFFLGYKSNLMYIEREDQLQICPFVTIRTQYAEVQVRLCIQLPHIHVDNSRDQEYVYLIFVSPLIDMRVKAKVKENPGTTGVRIHIDNDLYNSLTLGGYMPKVKFLNYV